MKINNNVIEAEFKYTKDEYVSSRRKFLRESKIISNGNILFLITMTLIEILFIFIHEFFFAIIIGVLLVISYVLVYILYFIYPKKLYDKTSFLKEKMNIKINKDEIKIRRGKKEYIISWIDIPQILETKDFIYVFQDKINYFLILKRALKKNSDTYNLQKMYCEANTSRTI